MEIPFWHDRWQRNEIAFHQAEFNSHLQDFWPSLGLKTGARVFVPLCGKSRDLLWLRAQGHTVLGVEISPIAVRDFFKENNLSPRIARQSPFEVREVDGLTIACGDFFALTSEWLADVQAVFDRASLIALPPAMRVRYVAHMVGILPPGAITLLVTLEYPNQSMEGPPFSVEEPEVRTLYEKYFAVTSLLRKDVLDESPRFRERGLTALYEHVYRLDHNKSR